MSKFSLYFLVSCIRLHFSLYFQVRPILGAAPTILCVISVVEPVRWQIEKSQGEGEQDDVTLPVRIEQQPRV
jgi:hypothetical protein